jgi:hypothetical protein
MQRGILSHRWIAVTLGCTASLLGVGGGITWATSHDAAWSKPQAITSPAASSVYGVSCGSATFCAAVDSSGGAHVWRDGTWLPTHRLDAGGTLSSISCPRTTFCVAVSGDEAVIYNGRAWLAATTIGPQATYQVSCATSTFCVAAGASDRAGKPSILAVFNGHSWSTTRTKSTGKPSDRILGVSCATASYCVAVNFNGKILTFNGTRWTTLPKVGPAGLISVSCPAATFCLAVTDTGKTVAVHIDGWTTLRAASGMKDAVVYSLSCASTEECVALGLNGEAALWRHDSWSSPQTVFSGGVRSVVDVSCVRGGPCMAVSSKNKSSIFRWS